MTNLEMIQSILKEFQDIDPAKVTPDASFESLGIDSLDAVELITELEEELEAKGVTSEMYTDDFKTIGDLLAYMETL